MASAAPAGSSSPKKSSAAEEGLKLMAQLVQNLVSRVASAQFREPVDWRAMDLDDYPKVVKRPMDLGTVRRKLEQVEYRCTDECAEDLRLIWANCKAYLDEPGHPVYKQAVALEKRFEERYAKIPAHLRVPMKDEEEVKAVSDGDKRKFAIGIRRLTTDELCALVHKLDERCPDALEKKGADIEIKLDAIDSRTFRELLHAMANALPKASDGECNKCNYGGTSGSERDEGEWEGRGRAGSAASAGGGRRRAGSGAGAGAAGREQRPRRGRGRGRGAGNAKHGGRGVRAG
ncbi:unnamed protein product [Chrysoparadoxa australica]